MYLYLLYPTGYSFIIATTAIYTSGTLLETLMERPHI